MDATGRPVAGASVDYPERPRKQFFWSDREGRFALPVNAAKLLVRHRDFTAQLLRVNQSGSLRIVLTAVQRKPLRIYRSEEPCLRLGNLGTAFCFPSLPAVESGPVHTDFEGHAHREFRVKTAGGEGLLRHSGGGLLWSEGLIEGPQVWQSVEYHETSWDIQDVQDGWGKTTDGNFWRELTQRNETATYFGANGESAAKLNEILDLICLAH